MLYVRRRVVGSKLKPMITSSHRKCLWYTAICALAKGMERL